MSKRQREIKKIVDFVVRQRDWVSSERQWKRRLAGFGFAIDDRDSGSVIMTLPCRRVVCELPAQL